jgi:hypothetical protein
MSATKASDRSKSGLYAAAEPLRGRTPEQRQILADIASSMPWREGADFPLGFASVLMHALAYSRATGPCIALLQTVMHNPTRNRTSRGS